MRARHPLAILLLAGMLVPLVAGCAKRTTQPATIREVAPEPNSPATALRLLEWCWNRRDADLYSTILTEDFQFVFASTDSAGTDYRALPWIREDELTSSRHLFDGGGTHPPAQSIRLLFDSILAPLPDSRAGKDPKWHQEIDTDFTLTVRINDGSGYEAWGRAKFFVVRGDSAAIPPELQSRFPPDSARWWIERWEDQTVPGGLRVAPNPRPTWGKIKVLYR